MTAKEKLEGILWDYLMDCLAIHHLVKNRKIKTIPEAQKEYADKLLSSLPEIAKEMGWVRKEDVKLDEGKIVKIINDTLETLKGSGKEPTYDIATAIATAEGVIK